jgi:hypothetical protein
MAIQQFQRLLKQRTTLGTDSVAPLASESHANSLTDWNSLITATIDSSSDLSIGQGTPHINPDDRQEFRQEIMQMVIDIFD